MRITIAILGSSLLWAAAAGAECRDSAGDSYSFSIQLSPAAGCLCLMSVSVFEGPGCVQDHRLWGDTLGCSLTDRMAVTDGGRLVSILAPATAHPEWSIVAVLEWVDGRVRTRRLALEDLPETAELTGVVRPRFEGAAIRFSDDVLVPFARLEAATGW
jgi:hypothetical protein